MDELQLRMQVPKVALMADAIESHIITGDAAENTADLDEILKWLRYRLAKAGYSSVHPSAE